VLDESRATFTLFQRVTLPAFFGFILWLLYRMATVRVTAYDDNLSIRNVFKSYRMQWTDVKALRFNAGDPWLQLFDADGNRVGVLAVQASEGARASRAAKELAAVLAHTALVDRTRAEAAGSRSCGVPKLRGQPALVRRRL
jgi:hypothetical protein